MQNKNIYLFVFIGLILLVVLSMGSGPWGKNGDINKILYRTFGSVCHQHPERSFTINGVQMAVNTRCFGIFLGLLAGWLMIPLISNFTKVKKWPCIILGVAVIIQICDYTGNLFHIWSNTNESRFILGIFLGVAVSIFLSDTFSTDNQTEIDHG